MKSCQVAQSRVASIALSIGEDVTTGQPTCSSTRMGRGILRFNGRQIYGAMLQHNGEIVGVVRDLFFDKRDWSVQYLVVETGAWPSPRRVLLEPMQISTYKLRPISITTSLTRSQVESCPLEQSHPPVSQQYAIRVAGPPSTPLHWADSPPKITAVEEDPNLEGGQEIIGYAVTGGAAKRERVADLQMQTPDDFFRPMIVAVVVRRHWGWGRPRQIPIDAVSQLHHQQRSLSTLPSPSVNGGSKGTLRS